MQNFLLILSKENLSLSELEATTLLKLKEYQIIGNILMTKITDKIINKKNNYHKNEKYTKEYINFIRNYKRLAYTKKILKVLFICNTKELKKGLLRFDFKKYYKKNFGLRVYEIKEIKENCIHKEKLIEKNSEKQLKISERVDLEKEYSKYIWKNLESHLIPKVNLNNPKTPLEIILKNEWAIVCIKLWDNNSEFEKRKAHLRKEKHPTAMHPKMARAIINILNPQKEILDPFCGAGGILLEAALMKIKATGYDVDKIQIRRAKINLKKFKSVKVLLKDSTKLKNIKNIVTDLPYGKSSKKTEEINILYSKFIENIKGRAVIVFPNFSDYENILKNNLSKKLEVKKIIDYYVHKSLTRKIVLIDKR